MTRTTRNVMVGIAIAIGTAGMPHAEAADRGLGVTDAPVLVRIRTHTPACSRGHERVAFPRRPTVSFAWEAA